MASPAFNPLDLELLDRVYSLACLYIEAENLCCTTNADQAEQLDALRKQIFLLAGTGPVNFDPLSDKVLASIADARSIRRAA